MIKQGSGPATGSKWFMPLFSLGLGVAILTASWIGGHPGLGLYGLGVMAGCGLLLLAGGRSETIRGLRGDGRDERFAQIDLRATAFSGLAVIVALIVAWLVQVASGHSGRPYDWLLAIAGLAYLLAIVLLRWRG
ncbi:MAG: hypothetical protein ACTHKL_26910 [Streptosporangiaceae bacterium]